ncbi:hypothetical protein AK88_04716 [Plasmodium fragile]|uniref:Schizont-infected cell agglutination C-terminal domain-containing protein n=1 Tax=Plasmodium fragile TaxID=5857 RepID=A0A0D9QF76_PLAFR|nr:uncharacterized protein AK88_04716 [Plasmodium fragile]KJP85644.1 hypothetical protein AK88_04716 [Plasmodium fragile]
MLGPYATDILAFLGAWEDYLQTRKITDGKAYWKKLRSEVNIIFKEVTTTLTQRSGKTAGICGSLYTGAETNVATCKSRCHEIANLMLYIRGYDYKGQNEGWHKRNVNNRSAQLFREYLKCTLGTEVLVQVYGQTSDHKDIITKVAEALRQPDKPGQQHYVPGVCEGRDYGEAIFGLRGIGPSIKTKLDDWKKGFAGRTTGTTHGRVQKCAWAEQDVEESDQQCNEQAGAPPQDSELMQSIQWWTETATFERLNKVLDDMQDKGESKWKCEIQIKIKEKIKEKVQEMKKTVNRTVTTAAGGHVTGTARGGSGGGRGRPGGSGAGGGRGRGEPPSSQSPGPGTGPGRRPRPRPRQHPKSPEPPTKSQPPEKPAGANGNPRGPVQPVAEKPVATTTTTSSGSGGGTTRSAAIGLGKGYKGDTQAAKDFLVNVLVSYIKDRGIPGNDRDRQFYDKFWADMKTVYEEFVKYMEKPDQQGPYGTLCQEAAKHQHQENMLQGDRVVCEFMLGALLFKHGLDVSGAGRSAQGTAEHVTQTQRYMKCMIVNVFIDSMLVPECLETEDARYAEKAIYELLKAHTGFHENDDCDGVNFDKTQVAGGYLRHTIRDWIKTETIKWDDTEAAGILSSRCKNWSEGGQTPRGTAQKDVKNIDNDEEKKIQEEVKNIKGEVKAEMDKVQKSIESNKDAIQSKAVTAAKPVATTAAAEEKEPKKEKAPPAKVPEVPKKPVPDRNTPEPGSGTDGRGRSDDSATGSIPPPPPAAPPTATSAGDTQSSGSPPSPEPARPAAPADPGPGGASSGTASTGTVGCPDKEGTSSGVSITCGTYTGPGLEAPRIPPGVQITLEDANTGPDEHANKVTQGIDPAGSGVQPGLAPVPPSSAVQPEAKPSASETTTTSPEATPKSTGTETTSTANAGDDSTRDRGNAVVDGGNDDAPPPLNPPKPKPNPNPDQASGGTAGTGGGADQSSGGGAGGASGGGGGGHFQLDLAPKELDVGGAAGGFSPPTLEAASPADTDKGLSGPSSDGPDGPDLTNTVLTATTPVLFFLTAVTVALLGYSLWKYFAYLAKRRRTYRTVRDVPSPPLDEEILEHLQRGAPPLHYGYTMIRDRRAASAAEHRRRRSPRVHRRTIIELHLEELNECEAAAWENVKDDYLHIVVQEFAQDLMRDEDTNNNILDAPTTNQDLSGNNVSSTVDPSTDIERTDACPPNDPDPWSCMETIQLATEPCPPNDCDPWSCMETMELDAEQSRAPTVPGDETSDCTHWINWIDRNKHLLQDCTTQTWFLQLKAEWKQYLLAHMVATEDNGVYGHSELGDAAILPMKKLDLWRQCVAQQHRQMSMYKEEWFKHLLENIEEETVPGKRDVSGVEKDLKMEIVTAAEDMLQVRDLPRSQPLHQQPHMKKPLSTKIWILILALVIEQYELESRFQEKELYVDTLLEHL